MWSSLTWKPSFAAPVYRRCARRGSIASSVRLLQPKRNRLEPSGSAPFCAIKRGRNRETCSAMEFFSWGANPGVGSLHRTRDDEQPGVAA
jgi:hypothetical protein